MHQVGEMRIGEMRVGEKNGWFEVHAKISVMALAKTLPLKACTQTE